MRWLWIASLAVFVAASVANAEVVTAARPLPAGTVIAANDVLLSDGQAGGAAHDLAQVVGQELRRTVYAGRAIQVADLGAPALVERNQTVRLTYRQGGLAILTEGRALDRGGVGEIVRVMNTSSHATVRALVNADGSLVVLSQ